MLVDQKTKTLLQFVVPSWIERHAPLDVVMRMMACLDILCLIDLMKLIVHSLDSLSEPLIVVLGEALLLGVSFLKLLEIVFLSLPLLSFSAALVACEALDGLSLHAVLLHVELLRAHSEELLPLGENRVHVKAVVPVESLSFEFEALRAQLLVAQQLHAFLDLRKGFEVLQSVLLIGFRAPTPSLGRSLEHLWNAFEGKALVLGVFIDLLLHGLFSSQG